MTLGTDKATELAWFKANKALLVLRANKALLVLRANKALLVLRANKALLVLRNVCDRSCVDG